MRVIDLEKGKTPWFKYDDMEFQIRYIDDDEMDEISRSSTQITFDSKHQKEKELNSKKAMRKLGRKAIVNWRGMKRKNLRDLIEPSKQIVLDEDENWNDEIPFSEETKEFIVEKMHYQFSRFLLMATREVEAYTEQAKKEELENLKIGSGGTTLPEG